MKKITKAVIPAAGFGTRFLPITKGISKEMLPLVDKPSIFYVVEEAVKSGIKDILIIINSSKNDIIKYFDRNLALEAFLIEKNKEELIKELNLDEDIKIHFINQPIAKGLGHAILMAEAFVGNEDFAVLLGDDIFVSKNPALNQLINVYNERDHQTVVGTMEVSSDKTHLYGICVVEKNYTDRLDLLSSVVEKPKVAPSNIAISGRYVLNNEIFKYLKTQKPGSGGEIQLTDSILRLMEEKKVYSLKMDSRRYDIGSKIGYLEAQIDFYLNDKNLAEDAKTLILEKIKNL